VGFTAKLQPEQSVACIRCGPDKGRYLIEKRKLSMHATPSNALYIAGTEEMIAGGLGCFGRFCTFVELKGTLPDLHLRSAR
jgi:hypothetical protein